MIKVQINNYLSWTRPRNNIELQFGIHGTKLSQSLSHTHQGIHFQSDGHWNKHIHTIHDKAAKILNLLSMLKYKINRKSYVIKYNAWVRQVLEY